MKSTTVTLQPLRLSDREQFILDNQEAFRYGATEEFGLRDDHFEEEGEIISRETIERSLDAVGAEAYRILDNGEAVGGVILQIDPKTHRNALEILFVTPKAHGKGIGFAAWQAIEAIHPETEVWETHTPHFETRNIHFYINKCGFSAVEFFNAHHPDPHAEGKKEEDGEDLMFRFEKRMK